MTFFKKQSNIPKIGDSSTKKSEKHEVSINRNHPQDTINGLGMFQNSIRNKVSGKNTSPY